MSRVRKLIASEIVMIDPLDCGSTVGYTLRRGTRGRVSGEILLSDCNRKIEWYFSEYDADNSVAKIDRAINVLSHFRAEFIAARGKKRK